jgi:uncharacterized protein (DUF1684 family)
MKTTILPVIGTAILLGAAAPAPTVQQWKAGWDDANKEYTQIPHATLKIQSDAYLHDGDTAVLVGTKGNPTSYHFVSDPSAKGVLTIAYKDSQIVVQQSGKRLNAAQLTKNISIDKDVDVSGQETQVAANVIGWRIFVYNQQNPQLKRFPGVIYYPYDPAWRITASFTPDAKLPPRVFRTSRGTDKQFYHVGDAHFTLQGKPVTLPLYGGSNDPKQIKGASAFFTDNLTGKDTYGAGRYVDVSDFGAFPPKTVTIDFNDAYNPLCAISSHFTCPIATDNISTAVKAGERDSHFAH